MQSATKTAPKAWAADQGRQDASWVQHLSAAEVEGFDLALEHARRMNKPILEMSARLLIDAKVEIDVTAYKPR